ncbi:flippase [Desulfoferrobacter suflitae]|uniref:flippase n=1 Tax=Desulfoferrobacter suflitae TaxID=2865782 RepID=UPI002164DB53|nr:flippase [Desulfoferrobacter suflitae]MCK8604363.1 flippase [Desulfoferrobacter suflitae]
MRSATNLGLVKLSSNIARTLARQLTAALLQLGTVILIARSLGPEGNGQYSVSLLLPTFLSTLLNLGIGPANVYYIGRRTVAPWVVARANVRAWGILAPLGCLVASILMTTKKDQLFPGVPLQFLWVALLTFPVTLLQSYLVTILQGMQDFRRFNFAVLLQPAVTLVLVASFLLRGGGVLAAVTSFLIGNIAALLGTYLLLRPELAKTNEPGEDAPHFGLASIRYGIKAHLSNILTFINYKTDIFLVNFLMTPAAAGVYVIAVQLTERLWILSQAVSTVILPRLSELHTEEDMRKELTPLIARWVLMLTFLGGVILAGASYHLIQFLFGEAYIDTLEPLLILLPGIILLSLSRILANDIAARGRPELNFYSAIIVVLINVVGNILLIPMVGVSGAAIATTVAYTVDAVLRIIMYAKLSGNPWYVPLWKKRTRSALYP